ncbi:MAG: PDZ domain-containing protein [Gammaproteobacteria bacterium]
MSAESIRAYPTEHTSLLGFKFRGDNIGGESAFPVLSIERDSPAARAGLRVGDIIREIDGFPVDSVVDLSFRDREGSKITVLRKDKEKTLVIAIPNAHLDESFSAAHGTDLFSPTEDGDNEGCVKGVLCCLCIWAKSSHTKTAVHSINDVNTALLSPGRFFASPGQTRTVIRCSRPGAVDLPDDDVGARRRLTYANGTE